MTSPTWTFQEAPVQPAHVSGSASPAVLSVYPLLMKVPNGIWAAWGATVTGSTGALAVVVAAHMHHPSGDDVDT